MNRPEAIILKEKGVDGRPLTQLQIGAINAAVALEPLTPSFRAD
jgi:hypothetical protein